MIPKFESLCTFIKGNLLQKRKEWKESKEERRRKILREKKNLISAERYDYGSWTMLGTLCNEKK